MKLEIITLKFSDAEESFDNKRLNEILEGKEVVTFRDYKFEHNGENYWNILVHYRGEVSRPRDLQKDYKEIIVEQDKPLFEKLRSWCKEKSAKMEIAPYMIMSNIDIAYIAHRRPVALAALKDIPGIGDKKAEKYGLEVLKIIGEFVKNSRRIEEKK